MIYEIELGHYTIRNRAEIHEICQSMQKSGTATIEADRYNFSQSYIIIIFRFVSTGFLRYLKIDNFV